MSIGLVTQLHTDYEDAIQKVTEALKTEGFGVLTKIDFKATIKEKLDVDFRPYMVLGACNPSIAHRALSISSDVGMLIPCNVTVSEIAPETIEVSIINPDAMLGVIDNPEIDAVAREVKDMLTRVIEKLSS